MLFHLAKPSPEQQDDEFDDENSPIAIQQDLSEETLIKVRSNYCFKTWSYYIIYLGQILRSKVKFVSKMMKMNKTLR